MGVFHAKGWVVAEKFAPSLESLSSLGFEERNLGCAGNFVGMSRTPEVCAKEVRPHFFVPYQRKFAENFNL